MVELFTITNRARFSLLSVGLNNEVLGVTLVLGSKLADNGEGEDSQIPDSTVVPGTWRSGFKAVRKQQGPRALGEFHTGFRASLS